MSNRRSLVRGLILIAGAFALLLTALGGRWASASDPPFFPTGSMANARSIHTATLLADGEVLVAGGYLAAGGYTNSWEFLSSAELFTLPAEGAPVVDAGPDQVVTVNNVAVATFSLSANVVGSFTPFDYRWSEAGTIVGTTASITLTRGPGVHAFSLVVTDSRGIGGLADMVVVTAQLPPP